MTPRTYFDQTLPTLLKKDPMLLRACELQSYRVEIELSGENGGHWVLSFDKTGAATLQAPDNGQKSDCSVKTKDDVFLQMMRGEVNIPLAVMTGKIKIKGDALVAAKIGKILRSLL